MKSILESCGHLVRFGKTYYIRRKFFRDITFEKFKVILKYIKKKVGSDIFNKMADKIKSF